jgi:hypothetical protein
VEDAPARVAEPLAEVGLVRIDEEVRVEITDVARGLAPDQHRCRLHPADLARAVAAALSDHEPVQEERRRDCGAQSGQPPRAGLRTPGGIEQQRSSGRRLRVRPQGADQRSDRAVA